MSATRLSASARLAALADSIPVVAAAIPGTKLRDGFYSNGQFATVWQMRYKTGESKKNLNHNAFFVKQLPTNFIKINTKEGDLVLDPFMGSGTTAIASETCGREWIGIDNSKNYCKMAEDRLRQEELF